MTDITFESHGFIGRIGELVRFAIAGSISVVLNLLVVAFLTECVGLHYLASMIICFVTVTFVSFWLNRAWTFRKREGGIPIDLTRYAVTTVGYMVVNLALSTVWVEVFHLPYLVAMALSAATLVPITYLLHRHWSFGLR